MQVDVAIMNMFQKGAIFMEHHSDFLVLLFSGVSGTTACIESSLHRNNSLCSRFIIKSNNAVRFYWFD